MKQLRPAGLHPYDYQHENNIRADLLGFTYTAVDQIYDPTGTYDVAYDEPLTQRQLMQWMARGLDLTPRFFTLPAPLVRGGAAVLAQFGIGTPGAKHLPINRLTKLALEPNPFSSERIRNELGWSPPYGHEEALARTGRGLR